MKALTEFSAPPQPRFNAWRLFAMIVSILFVLAIPLEVVFFLDLKASKINLGEVVFLSEKTALQKAYALSQRISMLQADSARMAAKIAILERSTQVGTTVSNKAGTKVLLIKPYTRKQSEFKSFGAWAVEGMRHYREGLNQVYINQSINYKIK